MLDRLQELLSGIVRSDGTVMSNENIPMTREQLTALTMGHERDSIITEDKSPVQYKIGFGPFPTIDTNPSLSMIFSNINKKDIHWGIAVPIVACLNAYAIQRSISSVYFKYALICGSFAGIMNSAGRPYYRLKGYSRNDEEASRYLGWKLPVYYDHDFLLSIPSDADSATIITQNPMNLPENLRNRVISTLFEARSITNK